jgi:DNA-3-methyladenine glycosylase II
MPLTLTAVPPFRLDLTVWALRRRGKNIVDQWDGIRYTRTLVYGQDTIKMTAIQGGTGKDPQVIVTLESKADLDPVIEQDIKLLVPKILGTDIYSRSTPSQNPARLSNPSSDGLWESSHLVSPASSKP